MGSHRMEGYFDYVVPPLEGFWWQENVKGIDYARKEGCRGTIKNGYTASGKTQGVSLAFFHLVKIQKRWVKVD